MRESKHHRMVVADRYEPVDPYYGVSLFSSQSCWKEVFMSLAVGPA